MSNETATKAGSELVADGLMSLDAACEFLGGISKSSLYNLLRTNQLASIRLGKLRMVPKKSLVEFAGKLVSP
jgi:hypothetical protein